ncbi:hypothetical protein Lfu02_78690 [Longispora fulva]|uniref:Uncharacterized protein n=1 Tax=Longispora fulva TaxID=619741 RepID=A0A8J7GAU3_9ACTN|nr:hypothetical protein [Longispora fulva]MBG6133961.1 hypothetical protein [Longispora fulva]GIG63497.1 hypothetical protein Lfu02_78690 [Longispora fulva]
MTLAHQSTGTGGRRVDFPLTVPYRYDLDSVMDVGRALGAAEEGHPARLTRRDGITLLIVAHPLEARPRRWQSILDKPGQPGGSIVVHYTGRFDPTDQFAVGRALGAAEDGRIAWLLREDGLLLSVMREDPEPIADPVAMAAMEEEARVVMDNLAARHPDPHDQELFLRAEGLHRHHARRGRLPELADYLRTLRDLQPMTGDTEEQMNAEANAALIEDAEALAAYPLPDAS